MDVKEEFINTYLAKASSFLDGDELKQLKNLFWAVSYDYSMTKIEYTEVATIEGSISENLMRYFYVGKISAGKSKRTLEEYFRIVNQLIDCVGKEIPDITTEDILYFFVTYEQTHNVSKSTMEAKRKALSSVFGYLTKHKKIAENPMLLVDSIKCKQVVKKPLIDEEIETLRLNCKSKKELAIVDFLLDTGVRVSELCDIKMEDVDFQHYSAIVTGKGNKEREVYFSGKTAIRLTDYLKTRNDLYETSFGYQYPVGTPLFSSRGNKKYTRFGIESMIRDLRERSGVYRVHPHLFRATFATNLAQCGTPANIIARALGHANLSTVERYIRMNTKDVELQIRNAGFH